MELREIRRPLQNTVFYDGECAFCSFQMKVLTRLDWWHRLDLVPLTDPRAGVWAPSLTREQLLEAIHCVTPLGRVYRGARCLRFVGLRLPMLVPVTLVLWFPGVIWVAEWMYERVARNRQLLSRWFGCKEVCADSRLTRVSSEKNSDKL